MSNKSISADNQQERLVIQSLTPDYIVGLIDGEGYFSVSSRKREFPSYSTVDVRLVFGVKLKESDREILERLRDYFECGEVRYRRDDREKFCSCYEYQVTTHRDILSTIIPFFELNILQFPSKRRDFDLFRSIAIFVSTKQHLQEGGLDFVKKIAMQMH